MSAAFVKGCEEMEFPEEPELCFELTQLPDPPADWKLLGRTVKQSLNGRDLPISLLRVFAKFYLWGIYWTDKEIRSCSRKELFHSIWKLMYYTCKKYRPQSFADFYDLNRDTGPRFIKWEVSIHEPTIPISRHFPIVPAEGQPASQYFVRPPEVPDWISDAHAEQYLYPMYLPGTEPLNAKTAEQRIEPLFKDAPQQQAPASAPQEPQAAGPAMDPVERERWLNVVDKEERKPMIYSTRMPTNIPHVALPIPPEPGQELVKQKIEQAIMKITYSDLERHHDAPLRKPHPSSLAVSPEDLPYIQLSAHPTVAALMLDPRTLEWNDENAFGVPYRYRGRGPVWSDNSCCIDVCIVAGMLLDAGCTVVDWKNDKGLAYHELERAFIEVCNMNWDVMDNKVSMRLRDKYFRLISSFHPIIQFGQPSPTWAVWAESTRNFAQFQLVFEEITTGCVCLNYPCEKRRKVGACISVGIEPSDAYGVEISTMIERVLFNPLVEPCHRCANVHGNVTQVRVGELPYRLVLNNYNSAPFRPLNHTQNVTFRYLNVNGQEENATYRWLGGIYQTHGHVRLFWRDAERGEQDSGYLRMYDGQMNSGCIIGGVPPQHPTEQVPLEYVQVGFCVVFYERILNPTRETLTSAMNTVQDMANMVKEGKGVLINHKGWTPKEPQARNPLGRILNVNADRYFDVHRDDLPKAHERNPTILNMGTADPADVEALEPAREFNDLMDWSAATQPTEQQPAQQQPFNVFDSLLQSPSLFTKYPNMWPQGPPPAGSRGSLEFPSLPRTPTPTASQVTSQNSRSRGSGDSRNSRSSNFGISYSRRASARSYMHVSAPEPPWSAGKHPRMDDSPPKEMQPIDKSIGFETLLSGPAKNVARKGVKKVVKKGVKKAANLGPNVLKVAKPKHVKKGMKKFNKKKKDRAK